MVSIYFLEFIGTLLLASLISLLGKGYAHTILGITILLTGTLSNKNCFNPAIALCFYLSNQITLYNFNYYIVLETLGAMSGFFIGNSLLKFI